MKKSFFLNKETYKKILLLICLLTALYIFYSFYLKLLIPDSVAHLENVDQKQVIYSLDENMKLSQVFASPFDFDYLTLSFSDHDQKIKGETIISVKDMSTGDIVKQEVIPNRDIYYLVPVKIFFEDVGGGKQEKEYEVVIEQRNVEGLGLGIFGYDAEENSDFAKVNGDKQSYSISIGTYSYTSIFFTLTICIFVISAILLVFIFILLQMKVEKEEVYFLFISCLTGLSMFLFLSLNNTNDGGYHYQNSYRYANTILGIEEETPHLLAMREDDAEIYENSSHIYRGHLSQSFTSTMYRAVVDFQWRSNDQGYVDVDYVKINQSTIWDRIPSVVGLVLGRLLHLGTYPCVWLARILSFCAYVLLVIYAIRKIPIGKMTLALVAVLPRCIYSAMAITYDTMINAVSFVVIALYLKLMMEDLNRREKITLLIASFIMGAFKGGIYLPILLIGLIVFFQKRKEKKRLVIVTWGVAFASTLVNYGTSILAYLGISLPAKASNTANVMNGLADTVKAAAPAIENPNYDIMYPLREPMSYLGMLCRTVIGEIDNYIGNIVQGDPHLELIFPAALIFLFVFLLIYSTIPASDDIIELEPIIKVIIACILLIEIVGIMTVFLTVTDRHSSVIWGVNGRYFVPVLPLAFLLFRTSGISFGRQSTRNRIFFYYGIGEILYLFLYLELFFK